MTPWIIRRTDGSGGYYAGPGKQTTWIRDRARAMRFSTRAEAQAECCENETPEQL